MTTLTTRKNLAQEYIDIVIPQRLNTAFEYVEALQDGDVDPTPYEDEAPLLHVDVTCNGLVAWLTMGGPNLYIVFTKTGSTWKAEARARWNNSIGWMPLAREDVNNLLTLWALTERYDDTYPQSRMDGCHGCDTCTATEGDSELM